HCIFVSSPICANIFVIDVP
ncbi:unnamed protein product, partial [Allacma fusca]